MAVIEVLAAVGLAVKAGMILLGRVMGHMSGCVSGRVSDTLHVSGMTPPFFGTVKVCGTVGWLRPKGRGTV